MLERPSRLSKRLYISCAGHLARVILLVNFSIGVVFPYLRHFSGACRHSSSVANWSCAMRPRSDSSLMREG